MKMPFTVSKGGTVAGPARARLLLMLVALLLTSSWLLYEVIGGSSGAPKLEMPPQTTSGKQAAHPSPEEPTQGLVPVPPVAEGGKEDKAQRKESSLTEARPIPLVRAVPPSASQTAPATPGAAPVPGTVHGIAPSGGVAPQGDSILPVIRDPFSAGGGDMDPEMVKLVQEIKKLKLVVELEGLRKQHAQMQVERAEALSRLGRPSRGSPDGGTGGKGRSALSADVWPDAAVRMVMISDGASRALLSLDGSSFYVKRGDRVGPATVEEITHEGVTLALDGRNRMYRLPTTAPSGELPKPAGEEQRTLRQRRQERKRETSGK